MKVEKKSEEEKRRLWLEAKSRGRSAEELLKDPLLVHVFDYLEETYKNRIVDTKWDQPEVREELFRMHSVVAQVRAELTVVLKRGSLADSKIEKSERRAAPLGGDED